MSWAISFLSVVDMDFETLSSGLDRPWNRSAKLLGLHKLFSLWLKLDVMAVVLG